jgi:hypothetical protein
VQAAVPQPIDACAAFPYVDLSFTVNVREICASRWMVSELRSLIPSARDGREQRDHSPDSRVHPVLQVHQHCMKQIRAVKKVSQALVGGWSDMVRSDDANRPKAAVRRRNSNQAMTPTAY